MLERFSGRLFVSFERRAAARNYFTSDISGVSPYHQAISFSRRCFIRRSVKWRALSLPGRVAPQAAGEIIKTTIYHMIEEGAE